MSDKHLVIRLPNWLGDVIMTLPSLEALQTAGYTFDLLGKSWIKDLFSAYPYVTHSVPARILDIHRLYSKIKPSRMILYSNGWSNVLPLAFKKIKAYGYLRAYLQKFFFQRALQKKPGLHEVESFWRLTQFTVQKPLPIPQNPNLNIAAEYQAQAKDLLASQGIKKPFYIICPGAIGYGAKKKSKIWPYWQNLCNNLVQLNKTILICPGSQELAAFTQQFGKFATILPNLNLPLYAAVMQRARYVIANDSGPMHLAAAVQAPVLGIFGETDPQRTHPWGGHFIGDINHWPSCQEVLDYLNKLSAL